MIKLLFSISAFLALSIPAHAGPGGGHSHGPQQIIKCKVPICTQSEIKEAVVAKVIPSYISKGKIPKSWQKAEMKEITQKTFNGKQEWLLKFYNKEAAEPKKNLFVFVTPKGFLSGINHTGK